MARNIEIKARLQDFERQRHRAARIADHGPETIVQKDVFFNVPEGRLKLRFFSPARGQLIFYHREDRAGPKTSHYRIVDTDRPDELRALLEEAYGTRSVVRKTRILYLAGRTRIHLDDVESLGHFLELEVVLTDDEAPAVGEREARHLMDQLGVEESHLIEDAYVDLLERLDPERPH